MKPKIYHIGTQHLGNKYEKIITNFVDKYHPDAFLCESVVSKGHWKMKYFLYEPVFFLVLIPYAYLTKLFGKDFSTVAKLSKERNIPVYNIDITLTEWMEYFHRWFNPLIYVGIVYLINLFYIYVMHSGKSSIIYAAIMGSFVYFLYSVIFTFSYRNHTFLNKSLKVINSQKHQRYLLVCGKAHSEFVKENFEVIEI